ncbi:hypothetical protein [Leptolyngbya sp. BC1307]|nr:hypothetical protein [Leptolyngbya sp. BC1307]
MARHPDGEAWAVPSNHKTTLKTFQGYGSGASVLGKASSTISPMA